MDAQSYAKILSGIDIANPGRIVCKIYDKKYLLIESAEQTNDTIGCMLLIVKPSRSVYRQTISFGVM